jgi:putative tricarboxylic transport membrane protein
MLLDIFYVALGVFAGIYVGAIPGLSVTMATSLLMAMTYSWDTDSALALMMGVYVGGVYGGSRAAILLNIPGAPAAVATTFDGYPLALRGEAGQAIGTTTIVSVLGSLIGLAALRFASPLVSDLVLLFSPRDYFLLCLMGLMLVGSLGGGTSISKGIFAACVGLMLGVVGMDPITGEGRFTFGSVNLRGGINYITVLIGLFGIGEALYQIPNRNRLIVKQNVDKIRPPLKKLLRYLPLSIQSSLIGVGVGALPGAGGEIAALLAYDAAKRTARHPEVPFGKGAYEGLVAPESANNAAIGGALIPMLTMGIPGDSVTAVFIGALAVHGLRAGPMLMTAQPELFENVVMFLFLASIFLLFFGLTGIRVFAKLVEVPRNILIPLILVISVIGSYSITGNMIDVALTLAFGVLGYIMKYFGYPVGPLVLGLILGPIIEVNFRRAMLCTTGPGGFIIDTVTSPLSLTLLSLLCAMVVSQVLMERKRRR